MAVFCFMFGLEKDVPTNTTYFIFEHNFIQDCCNNIYDCKMDRVYVHDSFLNIANTWPFCGDGVGLSLRGFCGGWRGRSLS